MKQYNCPDCPINTSNCDSCPRINSLKTNNYHMDTYNAIIPEACKHCPKHSSNGGDGICECVFGSMWIRC